MLGAVSSGAGGEGTSDLARATPLALAMETAYGLGADGPLWSHSALELALAFRADRALKERVRARLDAAEREATMLLTHHDATLDRVAQRLLREGLVEGGELLEQLAPCRRTAQALQSSGAHSAGRLLADEPQDQIDDPEGEDGVPCPSI